VGARERARAAFVRCVASSGRGILQGRGHRSDTCDAYPRPLATPLETVSINWTRGRQCSCCVRGAIGEPSILKGVRRVRHAGVSTRALGDEGGPGAGPASFLSMEEAGLVSLPPPQAQPPASNSLSAIGCSPPQSIRIQMLSNHTAGCSNLCMTTNRRRRVRALFTSTSLTGDVWCADRLHTPRHA